MRREDFVAIWGPPSTPSATMLIKDACSSGAYVGNGMSRVPRRTPGDSHCNALIGAAAVPAFKLGLQAMALWSTAADSVRQTVFFATNSGAKG